MHHAHKYNQKGLNNSLANDVTIGIPLYNEDEFIETAIHSAAPQCELLLVSDNCSSDKSESICRNLAKIYPNLRYVRQTSNMGAAKNFEYVMKTAKTEYFMWLGAHDYIPADYVDKLKQKVKCDSEGIMAYGSSQHINRKGKETTLYDYFYSDQLSNKEPHVRLMGIIKYLDDCSLIHGLFITEKLKLLWEDFNYLASDHVLLAKVALAGRLLYESDVSLYRRSVHLNDSLSNQLKRITGAIQNHLVIPRKIEMQRAQYSLACKASKEMGWDAYFYKSKCHFWLVSRFGSFSKNNVIASFEVLIWSASRAYRVIKKNLKNILLYSKKSKI